MRNLSPENAAVNGPEIRNRYGDIGTDLPVNKSQQRRGEIRSGSIVQRHIDAVIIVSNRATVVVAGDPLR